MEKQALLYIELLKKTLIDFHRTGTIEYIPATTTRKLRLFIKPMLNLFQRMEERKLMICQAVEYSQKDRMNGKDWPPRAESMIGYKRLSNVQDCVLSVLKENVEGDFIETGVWRGGTVIFMRGILKALEIADRRVWVADSFEGLPKPNADKYPADKDDGLYTFDELRVSLEQVKENFAKYDLLDDQVKFLKGWFKDTLPGAPLEKLAVLRLDGDMYESTTDSLVNLYPKLSIGGYIIVDDWGAVEGCRKAVVDYRQQMHINDPIIPIDEDGIYWKKTGSPQ